MRIVLPILVLWAAGCQPADPMVGTWTTQTTMMGSPGTVEATFGSDGSYRSVSVFNMSGNTLTMSDTGTWKLQDNKTLKLTLTSMQARISPPNRVLQQTFDNQKERVIAAFNAAPAGEVRFEGNNRVTLNLGGQPVTFNRKP